MNTLKSMLVVALGLATIGAFPGQAQAVSLYGNANVQSVVMTNFSTRQAQLRSAIASDVSSGSLSPYDANSLTSELDSINAQEQSALAMGGLNDFTINQLNNLFSDVTNKLDAANANAYASSQVAAYPAPVYGAPVAVPVASYYAPRSNWFQSHERDVARQLDRRRDFVRIAQAPRNETFDRAARTEFDRHDQGRDEHRDFRNDRGEPRNFGNVRNEEHRR